MKRLAWIASVGIISLAACGSEPAGEVGDDGTWEPEDTVEVAVPAQPGGGSDIMARAFAGGFPDLREGENIVVENYDTVEGIIMLLQEGGNGEIIGPGNYGNMVLSPLQNDLGYTWEDLSLLALVGDDASYVVTAAGGGYTSAEDMLEAATGGGVTVGQVGSADLDSLIATQLEQEFDIDLQPVVFEGGGQQLRAVLAGDVDIALMEPAEFIPQVESGALVPLMGTGSESLDHPALEGVPTAADLGAENEFLTQWRVFYGPPELSDAQRQYWEETFSDWVESDSYEEYVSETLLLSRLLTGEELTAFVEESEARAEELLADVS